MDDYRADALFARYVEQLVASGVGPGVDDLADGDVSLAAALQERIAAFRDLAERLRRTPVCLTGHVLGHYRLFERIGVGGMGEVYRAEDTQLGREVALKILPPLFALDPQRRTRFEREARLLAALDHPGVGAIYGVERTPEAFFLVLELVRGETLAERLARGPLPLSEALPLLRDMALALEACHARGIVHRDLKPANVKVTPDGKAKLLDFGLGKELGVVDAVPPSFPLPLGSMTGMVLGTPAYMSPEQARGRELDERTDVWSFGCVAYEALTGTQAFPGETFSDVVAAVVEQEPDWARLPTATPGPIRDLLRQCLAKDRDRRLARMSGARAILDRALTRPSMKTRLQTRWIAWTLPAALLVVGLPAFFVARRVEVAQPLPARTGPAPWTVGLSAPSPTDAPAYGEYLKTVYTRWRESLGPPRPGPGRPIYYVVGEPPEFWVIDGSSGEIEARAPLLLGSFRRYLGPAVTPDGTRSYLSVWGPTGRLIPIDNASRTVMLVAGKGGIEVGESPLRMAFTPDGKRAYVSTQAGVAVVDTDDQSPTFHRVLRVPQGAAIPVGKSPHGLFVAEKGARVYAANAASDTVSVIDTDPASPTFHRVLPVPDGLAIPVGRGPRDMALDPARPRLYVANMRADSVSVIDTDPGSPAFHTVVATIALAFGVGDIMPFGVTVSPDGSRLYVPCVAANQLVVIDAASLTIVARLPQRAMKIVLSEDGRRGFLLMTGSVSVIDTDPTSETFHRVLAIHPTARQS